MSNPLPAPDERTGLTVLAREHRPLRSCCVLAIGVRRDRARTPQRAAIRGSTARCAGRERRHHCSSDRLPPTAADDVVDGKGAVLLPGLVDLHTHLREPGREDAETVQTGSAAAALGGYTAVFAMASTEPCADTAGVVEQVWRLGRQTGLVDVQPIGAVTAGRAGTQLAELGAMADSPARVRDVQRRWGLRVRLRAHAPCVGVRARVRRDHRAARRGSPADCWRADERGRRLRPIGPRWVARRGRGGDRRPGRAARRACRISAACLPRIHGRVGGVVALGQGQGLGGQRRGHTAPSVVDRRAGGELRPGVQGQPPIAHRRRRRGAPRRTGRWHRRLRRHRPRAALHRGQGDRVGRGICPACSDSRRRSR